MTKINPSPDAETKVDISEHLMSMPDVTPGVGESDNVPDRRSESIPEPQKDANGKPWDPNLYRANEDGTPKLNVKGHYISKNQGRPRKEQESQDFEVLTDEPPTFGPKTDPYENVAKGYIETASGIMVGVLGVDAALEQSEKDILVQPTTSVLKMYKAKDLDPRLVLGVTSFGILAGKLQKPSVKERWEGLKTRIKDMFGRKP